MDIRYLKILSFLAMTKSFAGRRYLSQKLGLGEGVIRRLLDIGKENSHILVNRAGVRITEGGLDYLTQTFAKCGIKPLIYTNRFGEKLCGQICVAFSLNRPVDNIVKFRDEVIRRGGCGAIIAYLKGGSIYIPLAERRLEDLDSDLASALRTLLKEGDTLIVSCGDNFGQAMAPLDVVCVMK
ncbi:MAG: DUF4443 domain-containing protein [Thermoproteus sp.]|jgi:hypothetical protein